MDKVDFRRIQEDNRLAVPSRPRRPSDPVHVVSQLLRWRVLHHHVDLWDVQTACCDILRGMKNIILIEGSLLRKVLGSYCAGEGDLNQNRRLLLNSTAFILAIGNDWQILKPHTKLTLPHVSDHPYCYYEWGSPSGEVDSFASQ